MKKCFNCTYYINKAKTTIRSFHHSWIITEFVTIVTRRVPLMDQKLPTLPEHPLLPVFMCFMLFM